MAAVASAAAVARSGKMLVYVFAVRPMLAWPSVS
jgi:hypothetical protein